MNQEIQLNIITFKGTGDEAEFAFYTAKQDGYCSIHKDDLKGAIEGLVDECDVSALIKLSIRFISSAECIGKA